VICRGVEQRRIVLDDRDREAWFKLLVEVEARFGWKLHSWTLLDNHFHLLVETTQPQLSRGMQRLNGLHATRFNRRYDRKGHLFQGRFETRVIENEAYVETVVLYIYENATRVGLRGLALARSGFSRRRRSPRRLVPARLCLPQG
jgi:REP element-mobilizing transposase RayT